MIKRSISYDERVTTIDKLDSTKEQILEVYITSKDINRLDDKIYVLLDIYDDSGEIKALLVGDDNEEFTSIIDSIKYGLKYRISGTLENNIDLPFIDNDKVFHIAGLQCYSDTIYGISIEEFNYLELDKQYKILRKYNDTFKNIEFDDIKDVKISYDKKIIYLLNNNSVYIDGNKIIDNVSIIHYIDNHTMCAIGNDNTITCLVEDCEFINNNNYHYKKIITNEFGVAALKDDGIVLFYGSIVSSVIDYSRFINVSDIMLNDMNNIIVTKDGNNYSLFHTDD